MNNAEFPSALQFLFEPHRYKIVHGGRGKGASWGISRALLIAGAQSQIRFVCARETQKSIADSVHALLADQIVRLGLQDRYEVQQATILGRRVERGQRTQFVFAGLKHNVQNIKSLEGADGVWVEEAQTTSKNSWDTLIPTIRKDPSNLPWGGPSEIWASFNAVLETDDTYKRFVIHPPTGAVVKKLTWRDNPWFPEILRVEKDDLKRVDPKAYQHVWEGDCQSAITGAIYANEIAQAEADGRICKVPYDRTKPVHTFWDLGFNDTNTVWFAQVVDGWYNVIDYHEGTGLTIADYLIALQGRQYVYGTDFLPHDGVDMIIHAKLAGDRTRSIDQLMRAAGRTVRIAPKMHVMTGINAVRTIFPQCRFDAEKCADGLMGLRHYQWGELAASGAERRQPLHNWASHPADGFRTLGVSIKAPVEEEKRDARPMRAPAQYSPFG